MKTETITRFPESKPEESSSQKQINFYTDEEQYNWLMDRKARGESASTIIRSLVRKEMESKQLAQAA